MHTATWETPIYQARLTITRCYQAHRSHTWQASRYVLFVATIIGVLSGSARAQTGSVAGQVHDPTGRGVSGVSVEVTSPALIEGSRAATTDERGLFRIPALPVGRYRVRLTRTGFNPVVRDDVDVSSDLTANVTAELSLAALRQGVTVGGRTTRVDVHDTREQQTFSGSELAELPTTRDIQGMLTLSSAVTIDRGICSGGVGLTCFPTVPAFNSHTAANDSEGGLAQGRLLIDGMAINGPGVSFVFGTANGLTIDPTDAEEIAVRLSGGLGESETGGATINIVPRTGGNRFSGAYFTSYLHTGFFDRNEDAHPIAVSFLPQYKFDYDVNGSLGGPIVRDRFWFHAYVGNRGTEQYPSNGQTPVYANLNEGRFAANYLPDRARGPITTRDEYTKANLRVTLQATRGNKFNLYWDEQASCANPCSGTTLAMVSPEASWTRQTYPNRLIQLSWSNPFSNRLLLEAAASYLSSHEDTTHNREFPNYQSLPRVCESGATVGRDEVAVRTPPLGFGSDPTSGLGNCKTESIISGSLNYGFAAPANPDLNFVEPSALVNDDTYRTRASASYVTGAHYARVGFDSVYYGERTTNTVNDLRLDYHYQTPILISSTWDPLTRTGNCLLAPGTDPYACGNMARYFPDDPRNLQLLRPRPIAFEVNTGSGTLDERVWSNALYLQDQWTLGRFSLSGAVRYDHAESRYGSSCIGPDLYVPVQPDGSAGWCSAPANGVRYHDVTPRWGLAWDVFGTGKTSMKWSMGKYLQAAGFSGLYVDDNAARRSTNILLRQWDDLNGNRIVDCDFSNPLTHVSTAGDWCGALVDGGAPSQAFLTFGRPPTASLTPNAICGRTQNASPALQQYCEESGQDLMSGWGKRKYEWQFGLGLQHELLAGLIGEVTYNRRKYGNLTTTDTVLRGCDFYGPQAAVQDYQTCASRYLNYESDIYDFYRTTAPSDPRLPGGGGYVISGLINQKASGALPAGAGTATLIRDELSYAWNGVDTYISTRLWRGVRLSGGTTTGRATRDSCLISIDTPNVKGRVGNDYGGGCRLHAAFVTNVRGTASYTVPWARTLVGTVYQYRPGVQRAANYSFASDNVTWESASANRAGSRFNTTGVATSLASVNLLDPGDLYGEALHLWDLKVAKTLRLGRTRINAGVDVFNLFNNDTILVYNDVYRVFHLADGSYSEDNPATSTMEVNPWGTPRAILTPRLMKLTVQLDF